MFAIVISEKGGAERREVYDRTEINVGRVQGNDLMLPKGNVSKRHARLLYRDGRFIVTDLKSTNGTYVNGRKIAQATIVREGDKIYIGDFVLRIETMGVGPSAQPSQPGVSAPPPDDSPPDPPPAHPSQPSQTSQPSSAEKALGRAAVPPRIESKSDSREIISHFPLEQDPDESVPAYVVPAPPRIPSAPRPSSPGRGTIPAAPPAPSPGSLRPSPSSPGSPMPSSAPAAAPPSPPGARRAMPPTSERGAADPALVAAHRAALATLVERARSGVDPAALEGEIDAPLAQRIDQALATHAAALVASGELSAELEGAVVAEARRELVELGPIGPLLADEDVSEIQIVCHDHVVAMQGRRAVVSDVAFTSEEAVARVLRRLCRSAGRPLADGERYVERRVAHGGRMFAVLPIDPGVGHMVVLRKPQRADLSLDDLVRSGTISRAIAGLFAQCVAARGNVLVTGSVGAGTTSLISALAAAGSTDDRVIVLQEDDELVLNQPHTVSILLGDANDENVRAVRAAARIHPDRLVVGAFAGAVAAEVVDAIGDGIDGVLAAARAPTLRQAVLRLTADLAATRAGLTPDAAREWLASAFDLVVEIARLRDGRHRVMRVAELAVENGAIVPRDVFTFAVERTAAGGAVEGSFHASGVIPRIVEDLAARGVPVDTTVYRRQTGR